MEKIKKSNNSLTKESKKTDARRLASDSFYQEL